MAFPAFLVYCLSAIVVVIAAILILLGFYYLIILIDNTAAQNSANGTNATTMAISSSATSQRHVGLDEKILASLPVFFMSSSGEEKIECAVCLTDLKDNDKGLLLPRCSHKFHAECIDVWFQSRITCPLCRSIVEAESPNPSAI